MKHRAIITAPAGILYHPTTPGSNLAPRTVLTVSVVSSVWPQPTFDVFPIAVSTQVAHLNRMSHQEGSVACHAGQAPSPLSQWPVDAHIGKGQGQVGHCHGESAMRQNNQETAGADGSVLLIVYCYVLCYLDLN
jgi:hypothetical protein